ncbi:MAG: MscL family protein, partial [Candidatus Sericytochromatia bacterium]
PELADGAGKVIAEAVTIKIGSLIQVCIEFALMAFAIFLMVKVINHLKRSQEAVPVVVVEAPAPTREEQLLSEIRDLLAARPTA